MTTAAYWIRTRSGHALPTGEPGPPPSIACSPPWMRPREPPRGRAAGMRDTGRIPAAQPNQREPTATASCQA